MNTETKQYYGNLSALEVVNLLTAKGYNPAAMEGLVQALEAAQSDYKFDGIISQETANQIREAIKAAKL